MPKDSVIVQRGIIGAGADDDTYLLSGQLVDANARITLSDTEGNNTLQLIGGLEIASSKVAQNTLFLTLNNGAEITLLGADKLNYTAGGSPYKDNQPGITHNYQTFISQVLDVAIPDAGQVLSGQGRQINSDGSSEASTPLSPVETNVTLEGGNYQLVLDSLNVNQNPTTHTLTFSGTNSQRLGIDLGTTPNTLTSGNQWLQLLLDGQSVTGNSNQIDASRLSGEGMDVIAATDGVNVKLSHGNDSFTGSNSQDIISGQQGKDELYGNGGADHFYLSAGDSAVDAADIIRDFSPLTDKDRIVFNGYADYNYLFDNQTYSDLPSALQAQALTTQQITGFTIDQTSYLYASAPADAPDNALLLELPGFTDLAELPAKALWARLDTASMGHTLKYEGNLNAVLAGSEGDDFLTGGNQSNDFIASAGYDSMFGSEDSGIDSLSYQHSAVIANMSPSTLPITVNGIEISVKTAESIDPETHTSLGNTYFRFIETFNGSEWDDYLVAGYPLNTLNGGSGNDTLVTTTRNHATLRGDDGQDLFVITGDGIVEGYSTLADFTPAEDKLQLISSKEYRLASLYNHQAATVEEVTQAISATPELLHSIVPFIFEDKGWLYIHGDTPRVSAYISSLDQCLLQVPLTALNDLDALYFSIEYSTAVPDTLYQPTSAPGEQHKTYTLDMNTFTDLEHITYLDSFSPASGDTLRIIGSHFTFEAPPTVVPTVIVQGSLPVNYERLFGGDISPRSSIPNVERTLTLTDQEVASWAGLTPVVQVQDMHTQLSIQPFDTAQQVLLSLEQQWESLLNGSDASANKIDVQVNLEGSNSATLTIPAAAGWGQHPIQLATPLPDTTTLSEKMDLILEDIYKTSTAESGDFVATTFDHDSKHYLLIDNAQSGFIGMFDVNDILVQIPEVTITAAQFEPENPVLSSLLLG